MHAKKEVRIRRGKKTRLHIRALGAHRLSVYRTAASELVDALKS